MTNQSASERLAALSCPRCRAPGSGYAGCAVCRAEGVPVNLVPPLADLQDLDLGRYPGGPWGPPAASPATRRAGTGMREGDTPIVPVSTSTDGRRLWIKDESRNPTGSHKDRAMTVGVEAARMVGASTVVAASSGNAGAAAAAAAAAAGLRCVVLTTTAIPAVLAGQIRAFGAMLVAYQDKPTRNRMMEAAVTELGWYPLTNYVLPGAGDNPYANEGYKGIAYELARDLGSGIDAVVVPTSGADVLAGIERGYRELAAASLVERVPRLIAAETATGAAFAAALSHPERLVQERVTVTLHPSPAFSIGSTQPTWQGLQALWNTGGAAAAVQVEDYLAEQHRLATTSGLFLEASSAVAVAAARDVFAQGAHCVVALGTGSGLKGLGLETAQAPSATPAQLEALVDLYEVAREGSRHPPLPFE